jgi:O-antigen/teichoic acid export membrane protein
MSESNLNPQASNAGRGRHIVRGVGSLTVQSTLNAVLGFILTSALLRYLPVRDYGAYSAVQVSVGIAGPLATFGLGAAAVRFLAPGSTNKGGDGWGAAKSALLLSASLAGIVSVAMVGSAPFLSGYFLKGASSSWVFYFGALWLLTTSVAGSFQALIQGMRKYALLARVLLASRFVAVAVAVLGLLAYRNLSIALGAQALLGAMIIILALPAVFAPLRRADPSLHYRAVTSYAAPLGLAALVSAVAGNADIVVVGGYLDPVSLGVYNATVVISSVLSAFFVNPLVTALFAETSLSSESDEEVRTGTTLALRFSMLTVLPASLFAAAVAPQLFDLFSGGGVYARGIPYLQLITFFYILVAVQAVAVSVLQGVGRTRQVLITGVIAALGELGLSVSLVPGVGLAGAALSRVVAMAAGCGVSLYFIRNYLKGAKGYSFFARALVASVIPALGVLVPSALISNRVVTLLPYSLLALALYLVCVKSLKLLGPSDKAFLSHLLPERLQWVMHLL